MYEPKYKLNLKDEKRFRALAFKEATGKITFDEHVELERLTRKDSRKRHSHPIMKKAARRRYYLNVRLKKTCAQLDALIEMSCPAMRAALKGKRFMDVFKK